MLTALMLALVFIPMSGSQTAVQYDPWADMNDDGKIDIKDIAYSSRLFGTLGDPTKSVVISGYNQKLLTYKVEIPAKTQGITNVDVSGFKKVTVILSTNTSLLQTPLNARIGFATGNNTVYMDGVNLPSFVPVQYPEYPWTYQNKMWIEPSTVDITNTHLGYRFNVTVWMRIGYENSTAWQVFLNYNTTFLKALRVGYTAGNISEWATHRTGGDVSSWPAEQWRIGDGYVLIGEVVYGNYTYHPYVPGPIKASLCWIEFEVVKFCTNADKTVLSISNDETFVLTPDLTEIQMPKHDALVRWWFNTALTYDIIAPTLIIEYYNPNDIDIELSIEIYLTT
jgi:hypothetical protein